jgi:DNA primase
MSTPVEKIKERLGIVDVVESYMKLDRAGASLKGKCPFHNEKTPSFFVSPERGSYYCFGCGAKGDIFSFVQAFEGLDFMGALRVLAQRAGVELVAENPKVRSERERLYSMMEEAAKYYEHMLWNPANSRALAYLRGRGLTDETIREFRLGFVANDWRIMHTHLNNMRYSDEEIERVGLTKRTDKGFYDRFRGRIMFPISDSSGRVIAFTGRILDDDGKSAKYLNSPETPLFDKSSVLYGLDKAKIEIRRRNFSILVEGQMDLILSHQAGFKNTVAGSGTALTDSLFKSRSSHEKSENPSDSDKIINNLGVVKRISPNIIMVYDSDKAGINAAGRSAQIALSLGMDVKIGELPEAKDPADLILADKEAWKNVLRNAKHIVEFELNVVLKNVTDPRKIPRAINEKVLPFLASVQSHMERSHFVAMIKDKTGLAEEAIWNDLKIVEAALKNAQTKKAVGSASATGEAKSVKIASETPNNDSGVARKDSILKKIFGILFWQESIAQESASRTISEKEAGEKISIDDLVKSLIHIMGDTEYQKARADFEDLRNELVFEAEVVYSGSKSLDAGLDEMLRTYHQDTLKTKLAAAIKDLAVAERSKDEVRALEILRTCQDLSSQIASLKGAKR